MTNPPESPGPVCGQPGHEPDCDVPWGPPLTEADYADLRQHLGDIAAGWRAEEAARDAENARMTLTAERNEAEAEI